MKIDGRCHCGAIAYEAEIDPAKVLVCHCTDCQSLSGSAFRVAVPAEGGSFKLRSGKPKVYVKTTAESGTHRDQAFCPDCGSPIYAGWRPKADAPLVSLAKRAGATVIGKTTTTAFAYLDPTPTRHRMSAEEGALGG